MVAIRENFEGEEENLVVKAFLIWGRMFFFFPIQLCTHTIRTKKKLNKKQLEIQWTQHLPKSPV